MGAVGALLGADWDPKQRPVGVQEAWKRSCRSILLTRSCIFETIEQLLMFSEFQGFLRSRGLVLGHKSVTNLVLELLETPWELIRGSWRRLEASWRHLGALLAPLGAFLERLQGAGDSRQAQGTVNERSGNGQAEPGEG